MDIYQPSAYVYKVTNKTTLEFYIGSRINKRTMFKLSPESDFGTKYYSSGKWKTLIQTNPEQFEVEILFRSNEEITNPINNKREYVAYWYEQLSIKLSNNTPLCINGYYINPDNLNKCFRSQMGKAAGMFSAVDSGGVHRWIDKTHSKFITGEYIALSSNRTTVKDANGITMSVNIDDPRLHNELTGINKDMIPVKLQNGTNARLHKSDSRIIRENLKSHLNEYKYAEITCPNCSKIGSGPNMTRYHFDNCKQLTGITIKTRNQYSV